jgi:hypothetical protein
MGVFSGFARARIWFPIIFAAVLAGCQTGPSISGVRLLQHQAELDVSGLKDPETVDAVRACCAVPRHWEALSILRTPLYTDMQWRSPTRMTGVGVAYVRMPLPLPAQTLIWLARQEYSKKSADGQMLGQWIDALGRNWFEGENKKYHVKGYVITRGLEAWFVYSGYKVEKPPSPAEVEIAQRAAESIVPTPLAKGPHTPTASAR